MAHRCPWKTSVVAQQRPEVNGHQAVRSLVGPVTGFGRLFWFSDLRSVYEAGAAGPGTDSAWK